MSENIDIDNTLTSVIEDKKNEIQVLEKQVDTLTDALSLLKKGNIDYSKTPHQTPIGEEIVNAEVAVNAVATGEENVEEENVNAVTVEENVEEGDVNAVEEGDVNAVEEGDVNAVEEGDVNAVASGDVNAVASGDDNAGDDNAGDVTAENPDEQNTVGGLTRKSVSFFDLFPEKVTRRRRRKARKTKRHRSGKKKRRSTRRR